MIELFCLLFAFFCADDTNDTFDWFNEVNRQRPMVMEIIKCPFQNQATGGLPIEWSCQSGCRHFYYETLPDYTVVAICAKDYQALQVTENTL